MMLSDTQIGEIFKAKKEEWRSTPGPEFSVLFARAIETAVIAQALEWVIATLNNERVDGTVSPEDAAYNTALDHYIAAIAAAQEGK